MNNGEKYLHFYVTRTFNTIIFIGEDVTKEYIETNELRKLVLINPVTNRLSKVALQQDINNLLEVKRSIPNSALIAFDVVHFNSVNKIFGRQVGDLVLNKIASVIEERIDSEKVTLYHTAEDKFFIFRASFMVVQCVQLYRVQF